MSMALCEHLHRPGYQSTHAAYPLVHLRDDSRLINVELKAKSWIRTKIRNQRQQEGQERKGKEKSDEKQNGRWEKKSKENQE
jgi:hypothetical protein